MPVLHRPLMSTETGPAFENLHKNGILARKIEHREACPDPSGEAKAVWVPAPSRIRARQAQPIGTYSDPSKLLYEIDSNSRGSNAAL